MPAKTKGPAPGRAGQGEQVQMESTTNALVRISELDMGHGLVKTVDARELHERLGVKELFAAWVKRQISRCKFIEGRDFVVFSGNRNNSEGRPSIEYAFTIYAGKHIAMMSNTDKGFEIRDYFIQVEEDYTKQIQSVPHSLLEAVSSLQFKMKELESAVKGIDKCTVADYAHKMHTRLTPKERRCVGGKAYRESIKAGLIPGRMIGDDPKYTVRTYPLGILETHFTAALDECRAKAKGLKQASLFTVVPGTGKTGVLLSQIKADLAGK